MSSANELPQQFKLPGRPTAHPQMDRCGIQCAGCDPRGKVYNMMDSLQGWLVHVGIALIGPGGYWVATSYE